MNDPVAALDFDKVTAAVTARRDKAGFSLFGGEPLLAPLATLERLWAWGHLQYGQNGVQTGGRPMSEDIYALVRKYNVNLSFSIDGPGECNDARRAGTLAQTREATAHSCAWLERALQDGYANGIIVTLHRMNGSADRLPLLLAWLRKLRHFGLKNVNVHALELDGAAHTLALPTTQAINAMVQLWDACREASINMAPFDDMLAMLRGKDRWRWSDGTEGSVGCTWTACDPMTTPAVQGIEADGSSTMCQRVNKTRTVWTPGKPGPLVRQLVLRATPFEDGGCKGCRQMITCKGQCPGTAIGGDWRKRSNDCGLWKGLLEYLEGWLGEHGEQPVTLLPNRDEIEQRMVEWWKRGRVVTIADVLAGRTPDDNTGLGHYDHQDHTDHVDHNDLGLAMTGLAGGEEVC